MHILLVEDEPRLARSYQRNLQADGHTVEVCHDGDSGYEYARDEAHRLDVIVLDVMLPGRSGVAVCRDLRRDGITVPVLLLTALDQTEDKVAGLDAGADDYLTKPFPFEELLARLRALVRRRGQFDAGAAAGQIRVGDLVIDLLRHEVTRNGRVISLTAREFELLEYLARNADRVLTRSQLTGHIWNDEADTGSNVLDTYIHYLRDKIDRGARYKLIHTVRGVGYSVRRPPEPAPAEDTRAHA